MTSLYWACTTLTTVGYGDISATNPTEVGDPHVLFIPTPPRIVNQWCPIRNIRGGVTRVAPARR